MRASRYPRTQCKATAPPATAAALPSPRVVDGRSGQRRRGSTRPSSNQARRESQRSHNDGSAISPMRKRRTSARSRATRTTPTPSATSRSCTTSISTTRRRAGAFERYQAADAGRRHAGRPRGSLELKARIAAITRTAEASHERIRGIAIPCLARRCWPAPARPLAGPLPQVSRQRSRTRNPEKAVDRLQLDATAITGNRELPKVMSIVPWKAAEPPGGPDRPMGSLIDECSRRSIVTNFGARSHISAT